MKMKIVPYPPDHLVYTHVLKAIRVVGGGGGDVEAACYTFRGKRKRIRLFEVSNLYLRSRPAIYLEVKSMVCFPSTREEREYYKRVLKDFKVGQRCSYFVQKNPPET